MKAKINNIEDLRNSVLSNYNALENGKMERALCKELNNTAGKIMASVSLELKYQHHLGIKKQIDFLGY